MLTWLISEVGPRPLGLARVIIGFAALVRSFVAWRVVLRLTEANTLRAPYADWLPDPTLSLVAIVLTVWTLTSILFLIGWRVPLSGPLLLGSIMILFALDWRLALATLTVMPALILATSGLLVATYHLARINLLHEVPVLVVVPFRGDIGDPRWMGLYKKTTEPGLKAMDIPYRVVGRSADIVSAMKDCNESARAWLKPVAVLLTEEALW